MSQSTHRPDRAIPTRGKPIRRIPRERSRSIPPSRSTSKLPTAGGPRRKAGQPRPSAAPETARRPAPRRLACRGGRREPPPELVWYVLKVQSSREDTIRDALQRRVKIQGLQQIFGQIVVPTEKITEIRNNKKRVVERKTYPGYIMVQMELNENA